MAVAIPSGWAVPGDPTVVPSLIANHIVTTATNYAAAQKLPEVTIDKEYLTSAIVEITPETQIIGAALLQVTFADPASKIARSGIIDLTPDGVLPQVDVNFPEGTPVWWRLAMVDYESVDATQGSPNLTLTFQHRIVSYLSDCWGPLGWPAGHVGQTRAQFLKMLVTKMPGELPKQSIGPGAKPGDLSFICPEINELQPVSNAAGTGIINSAGGNNTVVTSGASKKLSDKINKQPAVTAGTKLTAKGSPLSSTQRDAVNAILTACEQHNASTTVMIAAVYAGIGESDLNTSGNLFGRTSEPATDPADQIEAWLTGGTDFTGHGGLLVQQQNPTWAYWQIANDVERNAVWDAALAAGTTNSQAAADSYFREAGGSTFGGEAASIVAAFNGGSLPQGSGTSSSTTGGNTGQSDVAQLTRGQSDNPDEDSWTCMQRLAQEVNWALFTSPSPAPGVFGNFIYYADQPTIVQSKPALYLALSEDGTTWSASDPDTGKTVAADGVVNTLSATVDNTAMTQQVTRTVKGKIRKKTVLRAPQTPTQIMFNMICGWLEFNAGDVFVFHDSGPMNGRWIVEDVTCNMLGDLFAQFTLGPPTYPYPEPQAVSTTLSKSPSSSLTSATAGATVATGTAQGAADVAQQALARQQKSHCFNYQQLRPIDYPILTTSPVDIDCSGFAIACYKLAGLPDPSDNNYNGQGFTGDMITHCTQISLGDAQPGDLVFYGSFTDTLHVTVYIGNGQVISMGQQGDPDQGPWQEMGPAPPTNGALWRSNFLKDASPAPSPSKSSSVNTTPTNGPTLSLPSVSGPTSGITTGSSGVVTKVTGGFSGLF